MHWAVCCCCAVCSAFDRATLQGRSSAAELVKCRLCKMGKRSRRQGAGKRQGKQSQPAGPWASLPSELFHRVVQQLPEDSRHPVLRALRGTCKAWAAAGLDGTVHHLSVLELSRQLQSFVRTKLPALRSVHLQEVFTNGECCPMEFYPEQAATRQLLPPALQLLASLPALKQLYVGTSYSWAVPQLATPLSQLRVLRISCMPPGFTTYDLRSLSSLQHLTRLHIGQLPACEAKVEHCVR